MAGDNKIKVGFGDLDTFLKIAPIIGLAILAYLQTLFPSKVEFEKYQDMTFSIEQKYYRMIDEYDDSHNFFLSCDNDELLTRFKDKYGDRILTFDDEVDTSSRALLDVFLLSKNKNMILYHNSNFSEVAWLLAGTPNSIKVVSNERFTNPFWEYEDEEQISLLSE